MRSFLPALLGLIVLTCCSTDAQEPAGPAAPVPEGWMRYDNPTYRFSVDHPAEVVLMPGTGGPSPTASSPTYRARFMQRQIAAGPFADREIPELAVDIFPRGTATSLRAWLDAAGRVPAGASVEAGPSISGLESISIRLRQALAPNEFVYVASPRWIYRLTAVSETGHRMLGTVRLY